MHNFSDLFDKIHVSDRSTVHHQEYLNTVYTEIGICHAFYLQHVLQFNYNVHVYN